MGKKVLVATYDGVGGPATPSIGNDGFPGGPTDAGTYRVSHCGRHSSSRYRGWSTFRWGSEVKEENGRVLVKYNGTWTDITTVGLDPVQVRAYHRLLYRTEEIPTTWVFNDFGHVTCYLYRDRNSNARRDANEPIHGEFIHTTPIDEASARRGLAVQLVQSHGCIHVKPLDIEDMIKRRFLAKNNVVVVHRYSEVGIPFARPTHGHLPPFEVHFFPGAAKLCVVAVSKF